MVLESNLNFTTEHEKIVKFQAFFKFSQISGLFAYIVKFQVFPG